MVEKETVAPQISDAVTQANVSGLALTPAFALAQSSLSFAQSQGVLFANMISDQQQQSTSSAAATVRCVQELYSAGEKSVPQVERSVASSYRSSHEVSKAEEVKENDPFFGKLDESFSGQPKHF